MNFYFFLQQPYRREGSSKAALFDTAAQHHNDENNKESERAGLRGDQSTTDRMNRVATRTRTRAAKVATVGSLRFEQRGPGARRASQAKCRAIAKRPGKVEPVEGTSPATRAPGDELGHQEKISEQALRNLEVRRTKR